MRLFFLHKYGGIYIDLDIECLRSLDFLRHYGWVMPQVRARCIRCNSPSGRLAHRLTGRLSA
jgi:Glycosyltransferase sugar-binding region containing DXD motif